VTSRRHHIDLDDVRHLGERAEEVADVVARYLRAHPEASDTLEGIARWWLSRQRQDDATELVKAALDLLVQRGVVERRTTSDGVTLFRSARGRTRA
jgi:hypothetical protein